MNPCCPHATADQHTARTNNTILTDHCPLTTDHSLSGDRLLDASDELGHAHAEIVVQYEHFTASDQPAVDINIDRITGQLVERAAGSFRGVGGTGMGHVQVNDRARLRGKVISGNTRDVLNDVARESGANWSIQDGQLVIVSANDVLPGQAIVIRADTGMLGAPEINDKGIAVKCLMNPLLRVNGAIRLDNNGIKAKRQQAQALASKREKRETNTPLGRENPALVRLDPDGIYKVLKLTHKGDNMGQDWITEIECIGLDQPIPARR